MRASLKTLAVIPAIVAAVVIPPHSPPSENGVAKGATPTVLNLDFQEALAKATFSVPCSGCLGQEPKGDDDDALLFHFQAFASEKPCGISNITLNGKYLAQEWDGTHAQGEGSFFAVPDLENNEWFNQHDLDLSWESSCLSEADSEVGNKTVDGDVAQVITVTIKAIDGKTIEQSSGFTLSFKQLSPPELLRLTIVPDPTAGEQEFADDWRDPPAHLRLVTLADEASLAEFEIEDPSIEEQIKELKLLQAEAKELRRLIREKKKLIKSQMKDQVTNLKEELKQCDNLSCILKTIIRKAHGAIRIIYIRFQPVHHPHGHEEMGKPHGGDHFKHLSHAPSEQQSTEVNSPPHRQPPHGGPPPHDRPPPPPPPHHRRPPPPPPNPFLTTLKVLASALGLTCLFRLIHGRCCSKRSRVDRLARREERRNARSYRRAARRQAWRNWWHGGRDSRRIEDYEEKRALIREQEEILETAMQEEIRMLRAAHGVVNDLVRAEEGRSPSASIAHSNPFADPRRPLSRTNSLPDYRSEAGSLSDPPAYSDDEDSSDIVVNGFREYTPSTTTAWTPESSVIDVSPRPSAETMRVEEPLQEGSSTKN